MPALDSNALLLEKGNVYVGDDEGSLVELGAVRNVEFRGEQNKVSVDSDNRGTIVDRIRINGAISFDWLEPGNVNNLENIFKGIVTKSSVAGTPVAITNEDIVLVKNTPVFLANHNGDGSEVPVSALNLDGGGAALTEGTDFEVVVVNGKTAIVLSDSYGSNNVACEVDYTYTPATSLKLAGGTSKTATPRFVKVVGPTDADPNVTRSVILKSAVVDTELLLKYIDVETAGDVGVMPVTLKNQKDAEWEYIDEKNVA